MSPDGLPIYDQSREFPGAFVASCHSGVTLAAAHAERYAQHVLTARCRRTRFGAASARRVRCSNALPDPAAAW